MKILLLLVLLIGCGSDFEVLSIPNYLEKYVVIKEERLNEAQKNEYDFRVSGDIFLFKSSRTVKPHKLFKEPFVDNPADAVFFTDDVTDRVQDGFDKFKSKYNVNVKNELDLIYYKFRIHKPKKSYSSDRVGAFNEYIVYSYSDSIFRKKGEVYFAVNYIGFENYKVRGGYLLIQSIIYNQVTKRYFLFTYIINKKAGDLTRQEYDNELNVAFDDIFSITPHTINPEQSK